MGRTIKLLFLFFLYRLVATVVCTGAFMLWNRSPQASQATDDSYVTFSLVVHVVFAAGLSVHLLLGKYVSLDKIDFRRCKDLRIWAMSFVLIIGMSLWNNFLSELANLPNTMEAFFEQMMSRPLGIFSTVIMASVMEELLFRGAIQGQLMRVWKNPLWAILVSSLLFGVVHGNPAQIPFACVIGMGLGWVYYKTGSLLPCFFMHFVNNGSAVLIYWLSGNSEGTLIESFGMEAAIGLAVLGCVLTVLSIWCINLTTKTLR